MEGYEGPPPGALASEFWAPGWNSIQALNRFQEEIAGPLRAGDPGVRLVEPPDGAWPAYAADVPEPFAPENGKWRVVPVHHVFGSEELSVLSPGVAALAPEPYVALHPEDAAELGLKGAAEVTLDERRFELPVALRPELPRGVAALPLSLPGLDLPRAPRWAAIRRAAEA
jgi:NADH-quinone oxidoreductase subunit G